MPMRLRKASSTAASQVQRHPDNPLITWKDMPVRASCVYNPAVVKYRGRYVMLIRNDVGEFGNPEFDRTDINVAFSDDGITWDIQKKPAFLWRTDEINDAYDPRLTVMDDGKAYLCIACETKHGFCSAVCRTEDFEHWERFGLSTPDNRDMVLFPEKIGGRFARYERPMPTYSRGGFRHDIWFGDSPDLNYWGNFRLVLCVEQVGYANQKLGAGSPPLRTPKGWLSVFHAVDEIPGSGKNGWEQKWESRYTAGVMLTDLREPWKVIGLSREPILTPETSYEAKDGYRNNVIFPTAAILEDSGEVKIYYGAADCFIGLATASVDDLLKLCEPITT